MKASDVHCYITRYAENNTLQVPKPNSNYMKRSLSYRGVVCWNSLPDEIKSSHKIFVNHIMLGLHIVILE